MSRGPDYQKERSERQEQRILDALLVASMTAYQLAERLHLSRQCIQVHVRALMAQPDRRVHVVSFQLGAGRPRLVYGLGSGHDAKIHKFQQERVLDFLTDITIPQSAYQISERMGMGYGNLKVYIRGLKKRRKIHIASWLWSAKVAVPLYLIGNEPNAPKPTKRPSSYAATSRTSNYVALGVRA
jgi:DNA-binding CsgD family transcriptional regulator